jgi:uncharacterized protein YndB with AHSA1/START domain
MPATYADGALHFERRFAHPVEKVWRAISDPAELAHWFPCRVELDELRVGAPLRFVFPADMAPPMDGAVTALDPPRLLAFSWGEDELRFELEHDGEGCRLRFTDALGERDKAARDAAGWDVCLETLEQRLDGRETAAPGTRPSGAWRGHYEAYERLGFPVGAPVPD